MGRLFRVYALYVIVYKALNITGRQYAPIGLHITDKRAVGSISPTIVWFPVLNQARVTEDWNGSLSSLTSPNKTARH